MKKVIAASVVVLVAACNVFGASGDIISAPGDITQLQNWGLLLNSTVDWTAGQGQANTDLSLSVKGFEQNAANPGLGTFASQDVHGCINQVGSVSGDNIIGHVGQWLTVPAGAGNGQQQFVVPSPGIGLEAQALNMVGMQVLTKAVGPGEVSGDNDAKFHMTQEGGNICAGMDESAKISTDSHADISGGACGNGAVTTNMSAGVSQSQLVNGFKQP